MNKFTALTVALFSVIAIAGFAYLENYNAIAFPIMMLVIAGASHEPREIHGFCISNRSKTLCETVRLDKLITQKPEDVTCRRCQSLLELEARSDG